MPESNNRYYRIKVPGDKFTPCALAIKLKAKCLLESSSLSGGHSRYSILLVDEAFRIIQEKDVVYRLSSKGKDRINHKDEDILPVLQKMASYHQDIEEEFPVPAGGIGFLSFEFAAYCDDILFVEREDALGLPLAEFIFGHVVLVFDHYTDEITLIGLNYPDFEVNLEDAVEAVKKRIFDLNFNYLTEQPQNSKGTLLPDPDSEKDYINMVNILKEEIIKGNLLQAVPSRRLTVHTHQSAMDAYRNLRSSNPSPYQFYLDFDSYQLLGASPEVHVKVSHGEAIIRPIAGTRRRGKNEKEDRDLEKELLSDEKEKAEHLMLVDLARNDLGRVCTAGSIKITEMMIIERYSKVMHIVSEVTGKLREDVSAADVIRATFPAGTVSGAPKIQAIKTISSLEKMNRGFYAGLVGYFDANGSLDSCITIRSALKKDEFLYLQAGGGIVYDSTAERELEETKEKMRAMALAAGVEV
ncbi:anthranilate synthase component I family protein [Oceanispirochaeta sp.]|uniref:anthranilate synthase component I family protein n=1 Tax=Oceanispirochaeta sp. TaxID=2035350 RepID=UPI00260E0E23|nr:chorismate-binding protein [Oceanispirochaeta sp.]MDA3958494.1 chorismate-binding protein [Oceanispirochaeta sp.]